MKQMVEGSKLGVDSKHSSSVLRLQTQNTATLQDPNVVNALKDRTERRTGSLVAGRIHLKQWKYMKNPLDAPS